MVFAGILGLIVYYSAEYQIQLLESRINYIEKLNYEESTIMSQLCEHMMIIEGRE